MALIELTRCIVAVCAETTLLGNIVFFRTDGTHLFKTLAVDPQPSDLLGSFALCCYSKEL